MELMQSFPSPDILGLLSSRIRTGVLYVLGLQSWYIRIMRGLYLSLPIQSCPEKEQVMSAAAIPNDYAQNDGIMIGEECGHSYCIFAFGLLV